MFGIGRNACLGHLRRAANAHISESDLDEMPSREETFEAPDQNQEGELVHRALQRLPAERREVLVLSRFEFKTYEEIAKALDCTVGAVKVRVHRAMKQLREIYLDMTEEVPT
jgi:RNA polymerase sigma-70 factor (ECF subfamily)